MPDPTSIPGGDTMRAVRLTAPGGPDRLTLDVLDVPSPRTGQALVQVHAAAITRDELTWPVDRLPAIPSYEVSGIVAAVAGDVHEVAVGDAVYALLSFDHDGAAAEYVATDARLLTSKPSTLDDVESAAVPLPALSAWQGLFDHGGLEAGERVRILGARGGVGHLAVQIARARGAHVIDEESPELVDLVFDTVGGVRLAGAASHVRAAGRIVSIAEEPPEGTDADYFVVEPNRAQLIALTDLVERGELRPSIDSVFALDDARAAFERSLAAGKRGKVVLRVAGE